MSADSGQEVAIFTEALKHPVAERRAFLDRACAGDAELRRKVEALLSAYERLGDFLETPPLKPGSSVLDPEIDEEPMEPDSNDGDPKSN
jgi:eukaryotic-like serine/threonine-protein kinase